MKEESKVLAALRAYERAFYNSRGCTLGKPGHPKPTPEELLDAVRKTSVIATLYWVLNKPIEYVTGAPADTSVDENPVAGDLVDFALRELEAKAVRTPPHHN
jgi:hypothetical protein